jgi:hypothetical protein
VLLSKLSGSGSFKAGDHKNRKTAGHAKIAHDVGGMLAKVVFNGGTEAATDAYMPTRCQECRHHCYYSDGELRTSTGETVDTSSRSPDKYTHYCLGVPSGFRKLKHAVDWSGGETPTKWCPLVGKESDSDTEDSLESVSPLNREVAV